MFDKKDVSYHLKKVYTRASDAIPPEKRVPLVLDVAEIFLSIGNHEEAYDLVKSVTDNEIFGKLEYRLRFKALDTLHRVLYQQGKYDEAIDILNRAKELVEENEDRELLCRTLVKLGNVYLKKGELDRARSLYVQALDIGEESGETRCLASAYNNLAVYEAITSKDLDKALVQFQKALSLFETVMPGSKIVGEILTNLGNLYREKGLLNKALDHFQRAHTIASKLHRYDLLGHIYHGKAELYFEMGEYDVAWIFAQKALDLYRTLDGKEGTLWIAKTYEIMAKIAEKRGDSYETVVSYLNEAVTLLRDIEAWEELSSALITLGHLAFLRGLRNEAKKAYTEALNIAESHGLTDKTQVIKERLNFL